MMSGDHGRREPSFGVALFVLLAIVAFLMTGIVILQIDLHTLLAISVVFAAIVSKIIGYNWNEIQNALINGVSRALIALFIVVLIGMVIGSWIQAGTVPALIYYGLKILTPSMFLPVGFLICSLASLSTGSSWSTVGTVGLAMMGIGTSLGIPLPYTAGMVVAGASFGDKLSPLSDTTVLASASAEADLFTHIKMMLYASIPAFVVSFGLYALVGMRFGSGTIDATIIDEITGTLASQFTINIWVLLPVAVILGLSAAKVPALPAMSAGVAAGGIIAMIFQGATFADVLSTLNYGYWGDSGVEMVDSLLNMGGVQGMMWTFSLAFIALSLGGVLEEMGYLRVLVVKITQGIKKAASLCTVTIISTIVSNLAMGENYLSLILNGRLYRDSFEEKKLARGMLSRSMEQGGTLSTPLIPWTTAGAFMSGVLGVHALSYAPFAFFNWITPLLSIVLMYLGFTIFTRDDEIRMQKAKSSPPTHKESA